MAFKLPEIYAGLQSKGRVKRESALLHTLLTSPAHCIVTPTPPNTYLRRARNPFDPSWPARKLRLSEQIYLGTFRALSQKKDSYPLTPACELVVFNNAKLALCVASRCGQLYELRRVLSRGARLWCCTYAAWLLSRCQPVEEPSVTDDMGALIHLAKSQMTEMAKGKMLIGALERMDFLGALADMECHGIHLASEAHVKRVRESHDKHVASAATRLNQFLPSQWPNRDQFNWLSPNDLRSLLHGLQPTPLRPNQSVLKRWRVLAALGLSVAADANAKIAKRLQREPLVAWPLEGMEPAVLACLKKARFLSMTDAVQSLQALATQCFVLEARGDTVTVWSVSADDVTHHPMAVSSIDSGKICTMVRDGALVISTFSEVETRLLADVLRRNDVFCARVGPVLQVLRALVPEEAVLDLDAVSGESLTCAAAGLSNLIAAKTGVPTRVAFIVSVYAAVGAASHREDCNVIADFEPGVAGLLGNQTGSSLGASSNWEATLPDLHDALGQFRSAKRNQTTLFDVSTGVLSLRHPDSKLRGEMLPWGAATGRLSARSPNVLNFVGNAEVRQLFTSRFKGGTLIELDFAQLEVCTLALLSNDESMIRDLQNSVDFHSKRASVLDPRYSYDDIVAGVARGDPFFVALRKAAKTFSFQHQYGAGAASIAESTGLSPNAVSALLAREAEIFPRASEFGNFVKWALLRDSGQFITRLPSGQCLVIPQKNGAPSFTALKNFPVQGYAAQIVQVMVGRLWRKLLMNAKLQRHVCLTNCVHDSIWLDCDDGLAAECVELACSTLGGVQAVWSALWPEVNVEVPFKLDVKKGSNMGSMN